MTPRSWPRFLPVLVTLASLLSCGAPPAPPEAPASPPSAPAHVPESAMPEGHPPVEEPPTKAEKAPAAGKQELPPGHPPMGQAVADAITPPPPGSGSGSTGVAWTAPPAWVSETPTSKLRRAQYRVPGPGGDGECIVFYFGPGQGGDPRSNAERWAQQFKKADGSPAADLMKTSTMRVGDVDVLLVEVTGTYSSGMTMGMPATDDKPGYMLLGAIAEGPDANWFFKLTGPERTVLAERDAFERMVKSMKKGT